MLTVRLRSWASFKEKIFEHYVRLGIIERELFWFRGLGNADWSMTTTLDRGKNFASDLEREIYSKALLTGFRNELVGLTGTSEVPQDVALELLGRHHGLPTPLLDWTTSPYVAAFFAFEDAIRRGCEKLAVWALNRGRISEDEAAVEFIDDRELLRFNMRALEQRGVFLRIKTCERSVEELLGDALTKYELPARECQVALIDLEAMNITARNLFRDADAAARTAATSMFL